MSRHIRISFFNGRVPPSADLNTAEHWHWQLKRRHHCTWQGNISIVSESRRLLARSLAH